MTTAALEPDWNVSLKGSLLWVANDQDHARESHPSVSSTDAFK